jgi:hypothetical protein
MVNFSKMYWPFIATKKRFIVNFLRFYGLYVSELRIALVCTVRRQGFWGQWRPELR